MGVYNLVLHFLKAVGNPLALSVSECVSACLCLFVSVCQSLCVSVFSLYIPVYVCASTHMCALSEGQRTPLDIIPLMLSTLRLLHFRFVLRQGLM